jgi:hypothetical protein
MLLEMGFSTNDPKRQDRETIERLFTDARGRSVRLQVLRARKSLFDPERLTSLTASNPSGKVILYSGYTSTIRNLIDAASGSVEPLGPFSAVVDLADLAEKFAE